MIYEPAEDSELLARHIPTYVKNKSFLDMGAGSGIQSEAALKAGAKKVLAADINLEAISYMRKKNIPALRSNLFSNIKGTFDVIAFNPPYLPEDEREDKESARITSGGKRGDELLIKFLKQAAGYLKKKGVLLVVVSSLTPRERLLKTLNKNNLAHKVLETCKLFMERLEVWLIYCE